MKKVSLAVLISGFAMTGPAYTQGAAVRWVTESTDPAAATAVEERARKIHAAQQEGRWQAAVKTAPVVTVMTEKSSQKRRSGSKHSAKSHEKADATSGGGGEGPSLNASEIMGSPEATR